MNDIEIISKTEEDAKKQLNNMRKIARWTGLRNAYNKTKVLNTTRGWTTPERTVQKVEKFKYPDKYNTKKKMVRE